MRNAWKLFKGDVRRLRTNVLTVILVVGLVSLPSIFSWYNLLACWTVFDNTGNLKVAVANCDEGYEGDLVPLRLNIGDQVVKGLRENNQLSWVFTDEEDAVDGARSGRYYAAVVIPKTFSHDMMSFYSEDIEHASIVYYSNEKKNAVAPKVTDQGADRIARTINESFTKTMSEVGLAIASSLLKYADNADLGALTSAMGDRLDRVGDGLADAGSALRLYGSVLGSAEQLIESATALASNTRDSARQASDTVAEARDTLQSLPGQIDSASKALSVALEECSSSYQALPTALDTLFESASTTGSDAASQLRLTASNVDSVTDELQSLKAVIEQVKATIPTAGDSLDAVLVRLDSVISLQGRLSAGLESAAASIDTADGKAWAERDHVIALAEQARDELSAMHDEFDANLGPVLDRLEATLNDARSSLSYVSSELDDVSSTLMGSSASVAQKLKEAQQQLDDAAGTLENAGAKARTLADDILKASASGDLDTLRTIIGADPETLAQALSSPIQIERTALYPIENFGSAMAPLYTTLALWIGALLIMVTLKLTPSQRALEELDCPTQRQVFLGRFGVIALVSLLQSTTLALGNLLFIQVQAANPWLYMLCFWVSGLVFAFIIYAFTALLGNLGKALGVVLLIVQVSGGGGSFPLQLLPDFFQTLSPYLPISHAVNAMRAAMFGVYANDFWIELGTLVAFALPLLVLGTVLIKPLSSVIPKFVARVEESKLM